ncbi:MAG: hypothetical protein ACRCV3_01160 [Desulfovibrionaceae bacterium]
MYLKSFSISNVGNIRIEIFIGSTVTHTFCVTNVQKKMAQQTAAYMRIIDDIGEI